MKSIDNISRQGPVGRWVSLSLAITGVALGGTYLLGWTKGFLTRFK